MDKPEEKPVDAQSTPAKPVEATCPKCGHHFFHKLKEGLEKVGETAVDIALESTSGAFQDE
jgi:hypothetical protein